MAFPRSLQPSYLGRDWWDLWDFPARLRDQHFGLGLVPNAELLERPADLHSCYLRPAQQQNSLQRSASGISDVKIDNNKFQVMLDVGHFKPDELTVKVVDNFVIINGKHEERPDQHGFIMREFTRRYALPKDIKPENVRSSVTEEGFLTVEAEKELESPKPNEWMVPITMRNSFTINVKPEGANTIFDDRMQEAPSSPS